jgi:type I restriction enzyme, S subunit
MTELRFIKLKYLQSDKFQYGASESADQHVEGDPRYIRITDITADGLLRDDTYRTLPRSIANQYVLEDGDILLARSGATVGKSCYYQSKFGESCFAGYLIRFRSNKEKFFPRFIWYYTQSNLYWHEIDLSVLRATIQNVSAERYGEFQVPLLSIKQQKSIAQFLDRKTTKIDTLIAKKKRLMELLEEKRSALINQAVTKGVGRSVRMKDSGVSWIGEIPEHWEVCELRRAWTVIDCKHKTPEYLDDGYPLVSTTEVKPGKIDLSIVTRFISEDNFHDMTENRLPCKGDIIYSRNASLGSAAYVSWFAEKSKRR